MTQAPEMSVGAAYAPVTTHFTKDQQAERLRHCDIDPDLYGDQLDIIQTNTSLVVCLDLNIPSTSGFWLVCQ